MKISIEIPKACGENWEHMTVSQLGKFCQVCEKEVIDFTNTTDAELLQKIKSGQKICGRFKQSQLSRDLKPNNSKTNWKQLAVAAGFTSVLAIAAPANAQKTSTKTEQLEKTSEKNSEEKHSISAKDSIVISGTVTDEEDLPIPGVHIKVLDSKILTQTDFDGNFMIVLAAKTTANNLKLEFTSLGYETQVINADLKSENLDIKMNTSETITTGIVVVEKTNLLRRVGYFFKRLF